MTDAARRAAYWKRYWKFLDRWDPDVKAAQDRLFDRLLEAKPQGLWLDAGCGRDTFPDWRPNDGQTLVAAGSKLVGCDLDFAALRDRRDQTPVCQGRLESVPFRGESFCVVISNMVFEHLTDAEGAVADLVRVTRPGGRILIHTVNSGHYLSLLARITPFAFHRWVVKKLEGRAAIDVYPTQYRANTESRLCRLFEQNGCKRTWGGVAADLPVFAPYPLLFQMSLIWGLTENRLARCGRLRLLMRPNLLMEFERL